MGFGAASFGSRPFGGGIAGVTPGVFHLFIAGRDVTGLLAFGTAEWSGRLNERGTAQCRLNVLDDAFVPQPGHRFTIKVDTTIHFDGYIHRAERSHLTFANEAKLGYAIDAVDWNALLDRRTVNAVYENMTAGAIVRDILATILAAEGIIVGVIEDGPVVSKAVFPFTKVSDALRDLSDITGFQWRVTEYRELHFSGPTTFPAPFSIDETNAKFVGLAHDLSLDQHANKIYIQAGHGVTATQTERFLGNGKEKTWSLSYPVTEIESITITDLLGNNAVVQTVGVRQMAADKQWYYQKNDPRITADDTNPIILTTAQVLVVVYKGFYPLRLVLANEGVIADRKAAMGGTGLFELSEVQQSIDGEDPVLEFGLAKLRKLSALPERVTFRTFTDRLYPGHSVPITLPSLNLSHAYLVVGVDTVQFGDGPRRSYQIECALSEKYEGMVEYFAAQRRAGASLLIRENEVLSEPVVDVEPVAVTDAVQADLVTESGILRWDGTKRWGSSQWG
jgi:hypothetical protein